MKSLATHEELAKLRPVMIVVGLVLLALAVVHLMTSNLTDASTPFVIAVAVLAGASRLSR